MTIIKVTVGNARGTTEYANRHSAAHCSIKHEKEDENIQTMICQQLATFMITPSRPSKEAFLAIHLFPESTIPEIIWAAGSGTSDRVKIVTWDSAFNKPEHRDYPGRDKY
jgi:hypothetical protein